MAVSSCPHCGINVIPKNDRSCPSCGRSFNDPTETESVYQEESEASLGNEVLSAAEEQAIISRNTHVGIIFSIVWLAGLGSTYAFFCGLRALRIIRKSKHKLYGRFRAWWCILVGGLGMLFFLYLIAAYFLYLSGYKR